MGNVCCLMENCDKNIYIDIESYNKRKNDLNTKKSNNNSINNYEKYKNEDNCSILINTFNKDINYIVNYKESEEKKNLKKKINNKNIFIFYFFIYRIQFNYYPR